MYLDILAGIFIGLTASMASGLPPGELIMFAVAAALAPDIDFIVYLIRHRGQVDKYAHEHRDLFHRPLLVSGLGGALIAFLVSPIHGIIWFLGTLWHFVHDTFDGGFGIRWLDPFYHGYFTLASYSPQRHFKNKTEQRAIATEYGNPQNWWLVRWDKKRLLYRILFTLLLGLVAYLSEKTEGL